MQVSILLGLLFCNLLWSAAYSVSKQLMVDFHPLEIAFLRYFFAGVPLLAYCAWGGRRSALAQWTRSLNKVDVRILLVGVLTFFISPLCQMIGLSLSRAIDGSLMIAMEPLFTIAAACLLLKEKLVLNQVLAIVIALFGAGVLSEVTLEKLTSFADARLVGNTIFLLSVLSEAAYSTVAKPALDRRSPVVFMTVSLWTGIALLFAYNLIMHGGARIGGLAPLIANGTVAHWSAVLYLGLGCTAFAYLYWMHVLPRVQVSMMALTLYVQPVLGVVWGSVWLGETITTGTYLGALLILGAVWLGSRPVRIPSLRVRNARTAQD